MNYYHDKKYLHIFNSTLNITGKSVLEVGGSSSPEIITDYKPKKWSCVNLNNDAVTDFNSKAKMYKDDLSAIHMNVNDYKTDEKYDLIYSIDCFEHVIGLQNSIRVIFDLLKPDGHLFTVFGPIWSCDVGHHLSIPSAKGDLNFEDGVLEPWQHLTSNDIEVTEYLKPKYGEEIAKRATDFIYHSSDINRLYDRDYIDIVNNSLFNSVLILRNKHGTAPKITGATNTREFLWVLKKGNVSMPERALAFVKFAIAFALLKVKARKFK